jgi:transposase
MPFGKVLVAIANKHARQIWAMLAHDVDYDPHACLNDPMHRHTPAAHAA